MPCTTSDIAVAMLTLALGIGVNANAFGEGFSIEQQGGGAWLVRPGGERFFSFGVCCVNQGIARDDFNPANPGYAGWRHYADSNVWAEATLRRLKSWGLRPLADGATFTP